MRNRRYILIDVSWFAKNVQNHGRVSGDLADWLENLSAQG